MDESSQSELHSSSLLTCVDLSSILSAHGFESVFVSILHLSIMEEGGVDTSLIIEGLESLCADSKSESNKIFLRILFASVPIILFHGISLEVNESLLSDELSVLTPCSKLLLNLLFRLVVFFESHEDDVIDKVS